MIRSDFALLRLRRNCKVQGGKGQIPKRFDRYGIMKQGNQDLLAQFNKCLESVIRREKGNGTGWQERKRREFKPLFLERLAKKGTDKLPALVFKPSQGKAEVRFKSESSGLHRDKFRLRREYKDLSGIGQELGVFGTVKPRLRLDAPQRCRVFRVQAFDSLNPPRPVPRSDSSSTLKQRALQSELLHSNLEGWGGYAEDETNWLERTVM